MGIWNLIKLGLIALAVWLLYKSVRRMLGGEPPRPRMRRPGPDGVIDVMVQDPQCGTYLPRQEALRAWVRGQECYFCSEECRNAYLRASKREKTEPQD